MDSYLSSSQSFVRALKASSDPPNPGRPSKVEIARAAWDQKSFYAPRKAEVIVDLILNHFVKSHETHSISDPASWQLLLDVISPSYSTKSDSWLLPLVSRIPFTRIVVQFFESVPNAVLSSHSRNTCIVNDCIRILWPYCVHKANTDLLLECYGASLRLCARRVPVDEYVSYIIMTVANSFSRSFSASTTKKKTYSLFIHTHLEDWLLSLNHLQSSPDHSTLFECLYTSGIECLLTLDVLRDNEIKDMLFHAFEDLVPEIIMPILPRIFSSYIQTLRRNRNTIFGSGSSQKVDPLEAYREATLQFFRSCQPILNKATQKDQTWTTKALCLDVINQENLFIRRHLETEKFMSGIVNSILLELATDAKDTLGPVIRCLTSLTKIDYQLIENVLHEILSQLSMVPDTVMPALDLLEIVLQYHVKTRSLPFYIETLTSINFQETLHGQNCEKIYGQICHSAVLHPQHLDRLGKCSHEFLPLNQTFTVVHSVIERIQNLWESYSSCSRSSGEESPRKRRKIDRDSTDADTTKLSALTFSTAAAFASVVLSSFSADSVSKESQQELETLLNDFSSTVVLHSLSRIFKDISKNAGKSSWDEQVMVMANLRLRYAVGLQRSPSISVDVECSSKLTKRMSENVDAFSLPGSKLEILRTLFKGSPAGHPLAALDITLNISETAEPSEWFQILHMVLQRWLPLIDLQASKAQLERFVVLLVKSQTDDRTGSLGVLVKQALSSAEFWELSNIRNVLLAFIEQSTSAVWKGATALHEQRLVQSVFNLLLSIPIEYLSRTLRLSLLKRAILLDQAMASTNDVHLLRTLRIYVSRIMSSTDLSDNMMGDLVAYLQHLQTEEVSGETAELVRLLLRNLFKSSDFDEIEHLIQRCLDGLQKGSFSSLNPWAQSFNIVVEILLKEHSLKSFSIPLQDSFKDFRDALFQYLFPTLVNMSNTLDITQAKGLLEGWKQVLKLGRWLGLTDVPTLGEKTVQLFAFTNSIGDEEASFVIFCILLEEFHFCPTSIRLQRLEILIAAYVLLAKRETGADGIDEPITSLCHTLSPETFNYGLDFILTSLKRANESEGSALVHLLMILLQDSPQNTFHVVQNSVTQCISIFNDREIFTEAVHLPALLLLLHRCRDRPATLRQVDISGIWLFIAKLCAGAQTHDPTTSMETFHCIVSITTALVRLRRDLVLLTIPHLGIVLRRLIQSMQSPRPNLGPKQSAAVSRCLPSWINIQKPLGIEESKALSRLLESLNTKTVIRKLNTSQAAPLKAESLAKPFSKHAAYVIKAYVESLNDPLCAIPAAVRKELQPGLYALCGMMNNFSRDALMASATDVGEKAIVQALWREYEKQRYVGKG